MKIKDSIFLITYIEFPVPDSIFTITNHGHEKKLDTPHFLFFNKKKTIDMSDQTVTVVIPEDAGDLEEGDILTFVVDGQELQCPVPAGTKPGDQ